MVATEAVPFAKEGGVGDGVGGLPNELAALGPEVSIFLPRYGSNDPVRSSPRPTGIVRALYIARSYRGFSNPGTPPYLTRQDWIAPVSSSRLDWNSGET